jgi:hypothetical protein
MSDFELGQRVTFSTRLKRRDKYWGSDTEQFDKSWSTLDRRRQPLPGGEGIIIGKRTLSNGNTHWLEGDGGTVYDAKEHFQAYLIVTSLRTAPNHVLPEHITAIKEPNHD